MVFGCSDDMLRLCLVVSRTPVGDLCILHGQPQILEAPNLPPDFRKNMVSYHPLAHTYPKSPLLGDPEKVQHTPTYGTTVFRNSACNRNACAICATCCAIEHSIFDPGVTAEGAGILTYQGVGTQLKKL